MDIDGMKVTPRDQQVLDLLVQGCNNKEIAGQLNIVGSSRVDLQACKLEYSIVSPK